MTEFLTQERERMGTSIVGKEEIVKESSSSSKCRDAWYCYPIRCEKSSTGHSAHRQIVAVKQDGPPDQLVDFCAS